jgi:hypothetical protein
MTLQPVSKRDVLGTIAKQLPASAVEPGEISDHAMKPRGQQVRALCEQATRRRTAVLEIPIPSLTLKLIVDRSQPTPRRSSGPATALSACPPEDGRYRHAGHNAPNRMAASAQPLSGGWMRKGECRHRGFSVRQGLRP